ncbi:LPS assembly lipoprotein LptE [Deltaproteobacteria bacterium]|nr:LPS assembly lipoprotein LptE [Deltaproteobacteria bacterium]
MQHYPKLLLSCLLISLISACGFQLRGTVDLPTGIEPFYIGSNNINDVTYIELNNIFNANSLALTEDITAANYQLIITKQKSDRRSTAVGIDGRTAEYQLLETATYELKDKQGRIASGPIEITERSILQNNPNQVISTESEEKLLRTEMKRNLARKIARQISKFDFQAYEAKQSAIDSNAP